VLGDDVYRALFCGEEIGQTVFGAVIATGEAEDEERWVMVDGVEVGEGR
jgi:hypothetical protein